MKSFHRFLIVMTTSLALLSLSPSIVLSSNGYIQTAQWWQSIQDRANRHSHELQSFYAQVEAATADKRNLNQAFCRELVSRYPGSTCNSSAGIGVQSAPGNLSISFNFRWEINTVRQRNSALTMTYHIGGNSPGVYEITDGANIVALKVDSRSPENSRFTRAVIPTFSATASEIWNRKPQPKPPGISPVSAILNDAYTMNAQRGAGRMDQFAERFLTDLSFRNNVIDQVKMAYLGNDAAVLPSTTQTPQSPVAKQSVPPSTGNKLAQDIPSLFLKNILETLASFFKQLAWLIIPVLILFVLVSILKVKATKAATGYARRGAQKGLLWLIQELFALWLGKKREDEEIRFESQEYLLTEAERVFFQALDQAIGGKGYHIAIKPRLADLIQASSRDGKQRLSGFRKISQKHLDFVILNKGTSRIMGAVELDDKSHARQDRMERDRLVEAALEQAGIPLYRQPWQREYSVSALATAMEHVFNPHRGEEFSSKDIPSWAAREWE